MTAPESKGPNFPPDPDNLLSKRTFQIKSSDMPKEMKQFVLQKVNEALDEHTDNEDVGRLLKLSMDEEYGENWQVIIGQRFGSEITHDRGSFIYLYVGFIGALVFKSHKSIAK